MNEPLHPDTRRIFVEYANRYADPMQMQTLYENIYPAFDGAFDWRGESIPLVVIERLFNNFIRQNYSGQFITSLNVCNLMQLARNVTSGEVMRRVFITDENVARLQRSWNDHSTKKTNDVLKEINRNNNTGVSFFGQTFGYSLFSTIYGKDAMTLELSPLTRLTKHEGTDQVMTSLGYKQPVGSMEEMIERILTIYGTFEESGALIEPVVKYQMKNCPFPKAVDSIFRCLGEDVRRGNISKWNIFNKPLQSPCGGACERFCMFNHLGLQDYASARVFSRASQLSSYVSNKYTFHEGIHQVNQHLELRDGEFARMSCQRINIDTGEIEVSTVREYKPAKSRSNEITKAAGVYARDRVILTTAQTIGDNPTVEGIAKEIKASEITVRRAIKLANCLAVAGGTVNQTVVNPLTKCSGCEYNSQNSTNPFIDTECPLKAVWQNQLITK